jgi:NET1-associated nuclear protein 1 (U3 small nucleolar RNA-associated protein 17)
MELDVSNQNRVSRTDGKALAMTRVEHVALSKGSSWLAAVERRINGETSDSMCLKFYAYDPTSSTYVLNSFIEHPHKDRVVALTFHPHLNIVVTVGADKEFKVWQTTAQAARPSMAGAAAVPARSTWSCRSVGQYRNFHAHDCSFSPDGSLLAVAHGQVVTLWDALTMTLQHTLLHPPPAEYVRKVSFLSEGAHLIAVTRDVLYVWNLLTSSVWWSCEIKCSALTVDPFSKHFAVLTTPPTDSIEEEEEEEAAPVGEPSSKNAVKRKEKKAKEERLHTKRVERKERQTGTQVVLFSPDHPAPVYVWAASDVRLEPDAACPGLMKSHLAFVYSKQRGDSHTAARDAASLVYLNRHLELTRLDGVYTAEPAEGEAFEVTPDAAATSLAAMKGQPDALSAFQKLYGKDFGKGSIGSAVATGLNGELALDAEFVARSEARPTEGVRGLLSAPAHVIPPMSKLYHSFMGMVLQKAESSTHSNTNTTTTTTTTTTANGSIDASASTTTMPTTYNAYLTDEALFTRDVNDVDGFRTQQANSFLSALLSASTLSQSPSKRKRTAKPAATPRAPDDDADAESRPVKAKATPKKANATPNRKSKRPN